MGFEDRPYYRDRSGSAGNPLMWLVSGSVPLFTAFGIRVRMHASLILTIALVLLFGIGVGYTLSDRVIGMAALFGIVLLHEFGHCFTARWVGGEANDIMMTPIGGLAMAAAPRRWLPQFLTVAGGPAVNVIICVVCGAVLYFAFNWAPWRPFWMLDGERIVRWYASARVVFWVYQMSLTLLLFNLLPIFPLDGGQMLQAALWAKFGYYKSMIFSCVTGMVGSVLLAMWGVVSASLMLILIAASGFATCMNMRRQLLAAGPYADYEDSYDYAASLKPDEPRRRVTKRSIRRAQRVARQEAAEQRRIDMILAKVSAQGMQSLTWLEKRALRKATERQRGRVR